LFFGLIIPCLDAGVLLPGVFRDKGPKLRGGGLDYVYPEFPGRMARST
jgi:hypothetical protein